jgi:DNA polymerase I-like protein with 3'-5' exonuclease and polymerase domains
LIQGESGSITKYASVLLYDWIKENDYFDKIKLVLLVHDEINLEVSEDVADLAAEKLSYFMEAAGQVWCKRVPLKATAVIGTYWAH